MVKISGYLLLLVSLPGLALAAQHNDLQRRLAASPALTVHQSRQLSRSPDWQVRQVLASNRRTSPALLDLLARDNNPHVRIAVATNLSTHEATFIHLAHDQVIAVRSVVARFEYVPLSALQVLVRDPSADVRLEVAKNLNANRQLLLRLVHDRQPEVANTAAAALQRLGSYSSPN